ncbi:hypothetical protein ACHAPJ_012338 [Fusarium lateritium]
METPNLANQRQAGTNIHAVQQLGRLEVVSFMSIIKEFSKCRPEALGPAGPSVSQEAITQFFDDALQEWDTDFGDENMPTLPDRTFQDSHVHIGHFTEDLPLSNAKVKAGEQTQTMRARKRGAPAFIGIWLAPRFRQVKWDFTDKNGNFVNPDLIALRPASGFKN